jgi:uncharacterized membrane protein
MQGNPVSQTRRARFALIGVTLLAVIFVAGTFVGPLMSSSGVRGGGLVAGLYTPLCHQSVERSLTVGAATQSICARCSGLYVGGLAGLLLAVWILPGSLRNLPSALFFVATIPTLLDVLLPWVGLAGLSNVPRFALALPAGLVVALFLAVGIADLCKPMGSLSIPVSPVNNTSPGGTP